MGSRSPPAESNCTASYSLDSGSSSKSQEALLPNSVNRDLDPCLSNSLLPFDQMPAISIDILPVEYSVGNSRDRPPPKPGEGPASSAAFDDVSSSNPLVSVNRTSAVSFGILPLAYNVQVFRNRPPPKPGEGPAGLATFDDPSSSDSLTPLKRTFAISFGTLLLGCCVEISRDRPPPKPGEGSASLAASDNHYFSAVGILMLVRSGHLDQRACLRMHAARSFTYGTGSPIIDLVPNATNYRTLTLAGTTTVDGTCQGGQFSDPYGTWNNVVVEASIHVDFKDYNAVVKPGHNLVMLRTGTHCKASDLSCLDEDGSNVYWAPLPEDTCKFHSYNVLYQGLATKIFDSASKYPTVYSLVTEKTTFALSKKSERSVCGYTLIQTEHPKLIIVETSKADPFAKQTKILVDNLDAFSYINSKFLYVEKHLKGQIQNMYRSVIAQKCRLEQQVLRNAITIAHMQPDLFAYVLMKGPGFVATMAGEVAHIVKCIPVEVVRRPTELCYLELPVFLANQSLFLTPKTRIVVKTGTPVECNPLLPIMYRLKGGWMSLTPMPAAVVPPQTLEPLTSPTWKYVDAEHLAESGIYSTDDLDRLREHIMFPIEQPSLMNNFAKAAAGHRIPLQGLSIANLLDNGTMDLITQSAMDKLSQGFMKFGTYSAGFIGVWIVAKAFKLFLDTLIHGYALHSIYGWSMHLLGAIFSSVTSLLLHLGRKPSTTPPSGGGSQNAGDRLSSNPVCVVNIPEPAVTSSEPRAVMPIPRTQAAAAAIEPIQYAQLVPELNALSQSLTNLERRCGVRTSAGPDGGNAG